MSCEPMRLWGTVTRRAVPRCPARTPLPAARRRRRGRRRRHGHRPAAAPGLHRGRARRDAALIGIECTGRFVGHGEGLPAPAASGRPERRQDAQSGEPLRVAAKRVSTAGVVMRG
uniref:Uncharacterized protein n=1 Tax=Streptomyces sp. F12 TaxID=1436084 RepID=V9Z4Q1_9ACTN|nr:hypothetical protein pFRL6_358c [Streptomyces sp. F12]